MGKWNFYTSYKCLALYFWYIVASQGPVLKLLPCLSKENCLHIGLSWWGIKGIIGSRHRCSYCGYFKVWSTSEAVVETHTRGSHVEPVFPGSKQSQHAPVTAAAGCSSDKVATHLLWIRAETVHIPLFVKLPAVCFHYFCYTFYLYLNVLGNLRTNVKVKMQ